MEKCERLQAELDVLRGVGCCEDGDGSCGICIKCIVKEVKTEERERARKIIEKHFGRSTMKSLECTSELMNAE